MTTAMMGRLGVGRNCCWKLRKRSRRRTRKSEPSSSSKVRLMVWWLPTWRRWEVRARGGGFRVWMRAPTKPMRVVQAARWETSQPMRWAFSRPDILWKRLTWVFGVLLNVHLVEVAGRRLLRVASRHHLTVLRYTGWTRLGAGPFRSPVLLCEILYSIVSVLQHWVVRVLGNNLKRNYLRVVKHTKHSRDASLFCAIYKFTIDTDITHVFVIRWKRRCRSYCGTRCGSTSTWDWTGWRRWTSTASTGFWLTRWGSERRSKRSLCWRTLPARSASGVHTWSWFRRAWCWIGRWSWRNGVRRSRYWRTTVRWKSARWSDRFVVICLAPSSLGGGFIHLFNLLISYNNNLCTFCP